MRFPVVEDMEERILRLDGRHPLLDIIHDQDVDSLIEVDEIVGRIVPHRVGVLHLKEARGDIEHTLLRIELLGSHTDGIDEVGLSAARRSIDKHRVKLRRVRMLGYGESDGAR